MGVLVGVVEFNPGAALVFVTLLAMSSVIVGGVRLLARSLICCGTVASVMWIFYAPAQLASTSFGVMSLICLVIYIVFTAWLVYHETARLNSVNRLELSRRLDLQRFTDRIRPFVAPEVLRLASSSTDSSAGRKRKRLTVFFSDIEGFTRLMDTEDEGLVAELLNSYFENMNAIAGRYGGTVDKFIGDGMMVFFGDPASNGLIADAHACVAMALEMRARLAELSSLWLNRTGGAPVRIRIGIHTGYCLVGHFGCEQHFDDTALGSTVNKASRLESVADSDEILISAQTARLLEPWVSLGLKGDISLKGFAEPQQLYAVKGLAHWHINVRGAVTLLK